MLRRNNDKPGNGQPNDEEYEYVYEEVEDDRDPYGCLWGMLGAGGCLLIPMAIVAFLVITGANTIGGIWDGITGIIDPPEATYSTLNETIVLDRVQRLSDLTTTRFNYSLTVSTARDLPGVLEPFYGEEITMLAVGHINAGVDLSQLTEADITLEEGSLIIRLPPPVLQDCILNAQQTRVLDSDSGLFTSDSNIETQTRTIALRRLRDVSLEQNILDEANESAGEVLSNLLELSLSVVINDGETPLNVRIITSPAPQGDAIILPDTCL